MKVHCRVLLETNKSYFYFQCYQNTLCVSSRSNEPFQIIVLLIQHLQKRFLEHCQLCHVYISICYYSLHSFQASCHNNCLSAQRWQKYSIMSATLACASSCACITNKTRSKHCSLVILLVKTPQSSFL